MDDNLPFILMVDDSTDDVDFALDALAELNLRKQVQVTQDGAEALDFLYRRGAFVDRTGPDPAVLLLDVNMPRLNGFEVLRRMKGDPKLAWIPVVMLTSSDAPRDLNEARHLGAVAYIVKPVDSKSFSNAIKAVGQFWAVLNILPS
jgi:two-component system response regulator